MRLASWDLAKHLQRQFAPLYLIWGEEPWQKQAALSQLRAKALAQGFTERHRIEITAQLDWQSLQQDLQHYSLFAEGRFCELYLAEPPSKEGALILQNWSVHPNPDTVMVLAVGKLETKLQNSPWFQSWLSHAVSISSHTLMPAEFHNWLKNRCEQLNLKPTAEQLQILTELSAYQVATAAQLLDKISLLPEAQRYQTEFLHELSDSHIPLSVFAYISTLLKLDKEGTIRNLYNLKEQGIESILILWAVAREVRTLMILKQALQQGKKLSEVFLKEGIYRNRQAGLQKSVSQFSLDELYSLLKECGEVDQLIKTQGAERAWLALETLCLRFAKALPVSWPVIYD